MWTGRNLVRWLICWRQLVPEATRRVAGSRALILSIIGAATSKERSYLSRSAPKDPAMPQQPVSSISTVLFGRRSANLGITRASVNALA